MCECVSYPWCWAQVVHRLVALGWLEDAVGLLGLQPVWWHAHAVERDEKMQALVGACTAARSQLRARLLIGTLHSLWCQADAWDLQGQRTSLLTQRYSLPGRKGHIFCCRCPFWRQQSSC